MLEKEKLAQAAKDMAGERKPGTVKATKQVTTTNPDGTKTTVSVPMLTEEELQAQLDKDNPLHGYSEAPPLDGPDGSGGAAEPAPIDPDNMTPQQLRDYVTAQFNGGKSIKANRAPASSGSPSTGALQRILTPKLMDKFYAAGGTREMSAKLTPDEIWDFIKEAEMKAAGPVRQAPEPDGLGSQPPGVAPPVEPEPVAPPAPEGDLPPDPRSNLPSHLADPNTTRGGKQQPPVRLDPMTNFAGGDTAEGMLAEMEKENALHETLRASAGPFDPTKTSGLPVYIGNDPTPVSISMDTMENALKSKGFSEDVPWNRSQRVDCC